MLAVSVLFSLLLPISAFADEELGAVSAKELENATKVITTAISELNGTFSEAEAASASSTFSPRERAAPSSCPMLVAPASRR